MEEFNKFLKDMDDEHLVLLYETVLKEITLRNIEVKEIIVKGLEYQEYQNFIDKNKDN
jgi:hypothetical protein